MNKLTSSVYNKLNLRLTFLLITLICVFLMLGGVFFQYVMDLAPCPLCITQRVFICAVGFTALLAFILNPQTLLRRILASTGIIFAIVGGAVSARHTWLQSLPEELAPACGPGLSYMFDVFPLWQALELLFRGDGNCTDVVWSLLGLSIPGWTLVWFVILMALNGWQLIRKA